MDIGLMVEGQNGLTWERWSHILALAERLGFPSLFRSDHYFIGRQQDSLEAYLSFAIAARETKRIRFGPMVSPITFRTPVELGRMAAQLDLLSNSRFVMGLGVGWNESEHVAYGIPFPRTGERFDRLEEAIAVIKGLWGTGPATVKGRYYQLDGVDYHPKPAAGRPPILIGGSGERRTLRIVAQYAQEWNCTNLPPDRYAAKVEVLERHCADVGRDPKTIRRSMMTFGIVGPNEQLLDRAAQRLASMFGSSRTSATPQELRAQASERGMIVGTTEEVVDHLGQLARLGVQEVQFEHLDFDSDDIPEYLAAEIKPKAAKL